MAQKLSPELVALTDQLREAFGKYDTMPLSVYDKLVTLLDKCSDPALLAAYEANIKFVSSLALNRCIRRGLLDQITG